MEVIKSIISNIDLHINAAEKSLIIIYGENHITLRLGEDGRIHFDTTLVLDGSTRNSDEEDKT